MIKASRWEESSFLTSHINCDEDLSVFTSWYTDDKLEGMTDHRWEADGDSKLWIWIDGVF